MKISTCTLFTEERDASNFQQMDAWIKYELMMIFGWKFDILMFTVDIHRSIILGEKIFGNIVFFCEYNAVAKFGIYLSNYGQALN